MTRVAILWHMHQPFYEDLVTQEHVLPWVRLHALKDYYGMVALLREFPDVRMTFNLVPSMLVQLEAFAENRARDRFLELSLKPADELTPDEAAFIIENFFHAHRRRMIEAYPRYRELLDRRGPDQPKGGEARTIAQRFSRDDLRDLQVWHKLAWIDPSFLDGDERMKALVAQGRGFSEEDKTILRGVELELLNLVVPEYRALAARGQIEISTSPFYHPILPLLCDTNIYLKTHPQSRMPRQRFVHPEDAAEQLARAVACHERLFGRRPVGLWPSEGSVSDAMVPIVAAAGFEWMATDEQILANTLGIALPRDPFGHSQAAEHLYTAYRVQTGGASVPCLFRDHVLSDLIGFTYAGWTPAAAADDFVARIVEAGRRYRERTGGGDAVVPIILDGENAWEHFEGGGRPFLRALYRRLSEHPDLQTITMAEAAARPGRDLPGIFPGSWIDSNFYIWIGHQDDQRGWSQLADAREALSAVEASASVDRASIERAREELLIAEGSDWFWWYGDDHSSAHDLEFDDLFRRHVRNVYRLLQRPTPDELFASNISAGRVPAQQTDPVGYLSPTLDGEDTSYFEWLGAGCLEVRDVAGAMHQASRQPAFVTLVQFGFDQERLFLRLDTRGRAADLITEGHEFSIKFLRPHGLRLSVRQAGPTPSGHFWKHQGGHWVEDGPGGTVVAAGTLLEIAIPLHDLGTGPGQPLSFFVAVYDSHNVELERHPAQRPIDALVPDERFAARHWTV